MTFEQFKIDFDARMAAMSDEELIARLELAGCGFSDPWMGDLEDEVFADASEDSMLIAANSSELALAA